MRSIEWETVLHNTLSVATDFTEVSSKVKRAAHPLCTLSVSSTGQSTMSAGGAGAGAGAVPFVCVPEDAEAATSRTHDKEAVASLYTTLIAQLRSSTEERRQMEQAYLAYKKACGETVTTAALREYLDVHQEQHTELEAAHGERYGALVPTDVSGWLGAGVATLPTKGKIWFIHYGTYQHPSKLEGNSWTNYPLQVHAIDNYGNLVHMYSYYPYSSVALKSPTPGGYQYLYPLSKKQIDLVKTLPTQGSMYESPTMTLEPILKSWAEENFQRRVMERRELTEITCRFRKQLREQSQEIQRLQAELRAIKSAAPPTEDLLGITETAALPTVKSTAVFNVVEDASLLDT